MNDMPEKDASEVMSPEEEAELIATLEEPMDEEDFVEVSRPGTEEYPKLRKLMSEGSYFADPALRADYNVARLFAAVSAMLEAEEYIKIRRERTPAFERLHRTATWVRDVMAKLNGNLLGIDVHRDLSSLGYANGTIRECTGPDDPKDACGKHHPTENALGGGYACCCGLYWTSDNMCGSGAFHGERMTRLELVRRMVVHVAMEWPEFDDRDVAKIVEIVQAEFGVVVAQRDRFEEMYKHFAAQADSYSDAMSQHKDTTRHYMAENKRLKAELAKAEEDLSNAVADSERLHWEVESWKSRFESWKSISRYWKNKYMSTKQEKEA